MPPPIVIIVGGIIVLFIIGFVYALFRGSADFERDRAKVLQEFSQQHGFIFDDTDRFGLRDKIREFGGIGFANNTVVQAAHRTEGETTFYIFDQMKVTMSGASQGGFYTICLVERQRPFGPDMTINEMDNRLAAKMSRSLGGARTGLVTIETHDQAFDDRFVVFTDHPGQTGSYLTPAVHRMLLDQAARLKANLVIQVRGNRLAVHNAGQGVRTIDTVEELAVLHHIARSLDAAWRCGLPRLQPGGTSTP